MIRDIDILGKIAD